MKNKVLISIAAALVACGGSATQNTTPGGTTYSHDKFGIAYQPELVQPALTSAEGIDDALRVALDLTPDQFTAFRGNVTVIQDSVTTCPTVNCLPIMDICWADSCAREAGPTRSGSYGTGAVVSTTIHVQKLATDPCVFDIEYGMNLGFWLEQQKLGTSFDFGGNCPDCQAMNDALRASPAVCHRAQ